VRIALGMVLAASLLVGCKRQDLAADATTVAQLTSQSVLTHQDPVEPAALEQARPQRHS
jgi:hypothetical protein